MRPPPLGDTPVASIPLARPSEGVSESAGPLSEADYLLLRQIGLSRRPVLRAVRVARASAISTLILGFASMPFALFSTSLAGGLIVLGICICGVVEYIGAQRLRDGVPSATTLLGLNQLGFFVIICTYCVMQMLSMSEFTREANASLDRAMSENPEVSNLLQALRGLIPLLSYGLYALVALASLLAQGGLAVYYFTRRRHAEALRRDVPAWAERVVHELKA